MAWLTYDPFYVIKAWQPAAVITAAIMQTVMEYNHV